MTMGGDPVVFCTVLAFFEMSTLSFFWGCFFSSAIPAPLWHT